MIDIYNRKTGSIETFDSPEEAYGFLLEQEEPLATFEVTTHTRADLWLLRKGV